MKIGINGYEAVVPRFGFDSRGFPVRVGSSEFGFQLLKSLNSVKSGDDFITYLPTASHYDLPAEGERWSYRLVRAKKLWTLFGLSRYFLRHKQEIDVFFSPTHYLPLYTSCPSVISILDVSYLYFSYLFQKRDLYQLKLWGGFSVKRAAAIITISESSRNDIIREYGVNPRKVRVVYPGVKEISNIKYKNSNMDGLKRKYGIGGDFILFVGTLQPRKNIERLIEAFLQIVRGQSLLVHGKEKKTVNSDLSTMNLVIIGKKGWLYENILSAPERFGVRDRVKFLDSVTDEELPVFYKHALCFVLPSLYEGFGLPILEAMRYGCPAVTSNVSSLPEAGGDAAVYFDPENVEDIKEKIEYVLKDVKLRDRMVKKGYQQVKKFSWEKAAKEVLEILKEVRENGTR